jgi:hypothetical protein
VDKGNTILIIEHNMDVIKLADYIIDIGPEGGKGGGQVVAKGTPEIIKIRKVIQRSFLKKSYLSQSISTGCNGVLLLVSLTRKDTMENRKIQTYSKRHGYEIRRFR